MRMDVSEDTENTHTLTNIRCIHNKKGHFDIAFRSIVGIYNKLSDVRKDLKFCRSKLLDQKNKFGKNRSCIVRTLIIMSDTVTNNDPSEALQYYH